MQKRTGAGHPAAASSIRIIRSGADLERTGSESDEDICTSSAAPAHFDHPHLATAGRTYSAITQEQESRSSRPATYDHRKSDAAAVAMATAQLSHLDGMLQRRLSRGKFVVSMCQHEFKLQYVNSS